MPIYPDHLVYHLFGTASKIFTQEIASINSLLNSSIINHLAQFLQIFHIFKWC